MGCSDRWKPQETSWRAASVSLGFDPSPKCENASAAPPDWTLLLRSVRFSNCAALALVKTISNSRASRGASRRPTWGKHPPTLTRRARRCVPFTGLLQRHPCIPATREAAKEGESWLFAASPRETKPQTLHAATSERDAGSERNLAPRGNAAVACPSPERRRPPGDSKRVYFVTCEKGHKWIREKDSGSR